MTLKENQRRLFSAHTAASSSCVVVKVHNAGQGDFAADGGEPALLARAEVAHHLNGDQGRHGYHGHDAEGVGHNIAAHGAAGAHGQRQQEGGGHRAGGHAAGVEGDAGVQLGHQEGEAQGHDIAGDHQGHDGQARQDAQHGESHGEGHADAQGVHHGFLGHRAVGHVLHLFGEDLHGRLGTDDEIAHHHAHQHQKPGEHAAGQAAADHLAGGHKAHVHAGQEHHQPHIGIDDADGHFAQLVLLKAPGDQLKDQKHDHNGHNGDQHFFGVSGEGFEENAGRVPGGLDVAQLRHGEVAALRLVENAQQHDGKDGADGAERDETEAVGTGVFIVSHRGHTDAQGHNEGHGDWPGGDAAGVEGHGQKGVRRAEGQDKNDDVTHQQHPGQGDFPPDTDQGQGQEHAHAQRHGQDQRHVGDAGDLVGQHLQVWLGNGDHHAEDEAHQQRDAHALALGQFHADALAHGQHGHVNA